MKKLIQLLVCFFPWRLKRYILSRFWNYELHPDARIGIAYIYPDRLRMGAKARIGHLTVAINLHAIEMEQHSSIGRINWITGYPLHGKDFFILEDKRQPCLIIDEHAAITNRHIIDCTNTVTVGRFTTIAGFRSQILTHSIDLAACCQASAPVSIGEYCFIGTGCLLLAGSSLPDRSVLAAGSTLTKAHKEPQTLYAGLPAIPKNTLPLEMKYFTREKGFVN